MPTECYKSTEDPWPNFLQGCGGEKKQKPPSGLPGGGGVRAGFKG